MMMIYVPVVHVEVIVCDGSLCVPRIKMKQRSKSTFNGVLGGSES